MFLIAGLAEQCEHVLLICLHAGLVKRIDAQDITGYTAGKLKEIYIVTCYSLIPVIVSTISSMALSYVLSPDEFVFVTIFKTICAAYTFIILAIGIMKVHDFEFAKFLGTTAVTVITMLIIIFLIFLVFMLAQQVYGWIGTIFTEIKYR